MAGRPVVGPGVVPNPGQLPYPVFGQPPGGARGFRHQRQFGGIVAGDVSPDLPLTEPTLAPEVDRYPGPAFVPVAVPQPCVAPQIIEINGGLRHRSHTRVTYNGPRCH